MRNGPSKHLGPLPMVMLPDPPRAALDRVPFAALVIVSHFRAFFFTRSRDKSLILPFSLLPIHITTTTTSVFACHRQRMEGLPSRDLYQLWTVSIHPSAPFFPHSHSIFPNSLISRFYCHLPPHMRPRSIPGIAPFSDSYLRPFILPNLHSTYLPYPLIFFSYLPISYSVLFLQRFLLSPLGTQR